MTPINLINSIFRSLYYIKIHLMQDFFGAVKIKDGLFQGDIYAAQDLEFIVNNKVTHVINCASWQIPNHWEAIGIKYLSFEWQDSKKCNILDDSDYNFSLFYPFIENCLHNGSSVLVHCVHGSGRSTVVIISYMMKRFAWNLYKTLQFLSFRRVNIDISARFLLQLKVFESKLIKLKQIYKSNEWISRKSDSEEELLINTFVNTNHLNPVEDKQQLKENFGKKISWADQFSQEERKGKSLPHIKGCLKGSFAMDSYILKQSRISHKGSSLSNLKKPQKTISKLLTSRPTLFQ